MADESRDNASPSESPEPADTGMAESDESSETVQRREQNEAEGGDSAGGQPESEESPRFSRSVDEDLEVLKAALKATRHQLSQPAILEGALWYVATVMAVVLSSLVVAAFASEHGYTVARWMMGIGIGSATVGAVVAGVLFVWRRPPLERIASRLQRHHSAFRSDLVAALEFGRGLRADGGEELSSRGFSPAMARAHLAQTARRVEEVSHDGSLADCIPPRDLRPAITAFCAGIVFLLIPLVFHPGWTLGVLTGERLGAPIVGERVVEKTIVGSVEGVFVYPSYTDKQRQIRDLGTGRIESLEGTEVHLHTTLMPGDWAFVEMVVDTGEEKEVHEMQFAGDHRASATIQLENSGHYWFRGETSEGRPVEDPLKRRIEVREDPPPEIEIVSHDGRVEVEPDEVIEFDIVAGDRYGLEWIRKVHHFEGVPDNAERSRIELARLDERPDSVETTVEMDLEPMELRPKDAVVVTFEAQDVNTATGPGVSQSNRVVLYVESPEDKHLDNLADQQEAMEALVSHLADVLESPVGERRVGDDGGYSQRVDPTMSDDDRATHYRRTRQRHDQRDRIVEAFGEITEQIEDDPLMAPRNVTLFEGIGTRLKSLQQDGDELFDSLEQAAQRRDLTAAHVQQLADYAADTEARLERSVLDLEDLLVSQKMDLVEMTADQIDEMRDRLRDLLEQYRETEDPQLREAIEREIDRLRQRMQELMARMQMQMQQMPQEHVNLEALEDMEMQNQADDLGAQLDAIDEMLDGDDIDGALEALDEMEMELDSLTGEMEETFGQMQPSGISEFDEAVSEMMDEVTHLREMEIQLEEQTRQLRDELREERRDRLEALLDPVTEQLQQKIEQQHRDLDRIDERRLSERDRQEVDEVDGALERLEEMVEQQDMEESLQRARDAYRALQTMRSTMNLSQRYTEQATETARDLDRSIRDSAEMIERAEEIEERIREFMQQAQHDLQPDEQEQFDELLDDQRQISERATELGEQIDEQGEDYPQLQEDLAPQLEGAEEAMRDAEEHLQHRQIQRALDSERQAIEQLGELDDAMSQALRQQREREREQSGQRRRSEDEEVEIPGEDGSAARERIREEMMEGMRDGRIEEYESEIERYFRSLVE